MVVDLSTVWDPEDAITAAHNLAVKIDDPWVYERTGVALLCSARKARFDQDFDLASRYLRTAAYAFSLADQYSEGEPDEVGPLHRAMVHLEQILVTDSQDPWPEAAALLSPGMRRG